MRTILFLPVILLFTLKTFGQIGVEPPINLGDTYKINLYKDKCTDGKCKDGGSGTLRFKTYGDLKEYTGTFGDEGSFLKGLLTFNNGDTYEGTFHVIKPESKYGNLIVQYDSGTYKKTNSYSYTTRFIDNKLNGYIQVNFKDGATYSGTVKDGYLDGYGKLVYSNGFTYEGTYVKGKREGHGIFRNKNVPEYYVNADFKNDYPNGKGVIVREGTKDSIAGEFNNGHATGIVIKTSPGGKKVYQYLKFDSLVYDNMVKLDGGYCINGDCKSGKGKIILDNGKIYEGDVKNGKADGIGNFTYSNGTYSGSVKNNLRNGKGKTVLSDGVYYEGEYKDDIKYGEGLYHWANGDTYQGKWVDGKQNGFGTMHWADNRMYEGNWVNDKREGKGKYKHSDGATYDGDWKNDVIDGYGTYTWADGDKYVGEWVAGHKQKGILYWKNGNKYEGNFKDNEYFGQGIYTFSNGDKYVSDNWNKYSFTKGKRFKSGNAVEEEGILKDGNFLTTSDVADLDKKQKEAEAIKIQNRGKDNFVMHAKKKANLARDYWVELIQWDCIPERKYWIGLEAQTKYHQMPFAGHVTMQVASSDNLVAMEAEAGTYFQPRKAGKYTFQVKFYQDKIVGDWKEHSSYVSGVKVEWTLQSSWTE